MATKIAIEQVISKILTEHKNNLIEEIARQYIKTEDFRKDSGVAFKEQLVEQIRYKIEGISDYFMKEFDKFFSNNLTETTTNLIKEELENNPKFKKSFNKNMGEYLKTMNFEKTMLDFFNEKKELLMELMLRQMFNDKKDK